MAFDTLGFMVKGGCTKPSIKTRHHGMLVGQEQDQERARVKCKIQNRLGRAQENEAWVTARAHYATRRHARHCKEARSRHQEKNGHGMLQGGMLEHRKTIVHGEAVHADAERVLGWWCDAEERHDANCGLNVPQGEVKCERGSDCRLVGCGQNRWTRQYEAVGTRMLCLEFSLSRLLGLCCSLRLNRGFESCRVCASGRT